MVGRLKLKKAFSFLLMLLLTSGLSVHAALKGGSWQTVAAATGAINGTPPRADGAAVPVYQGSILLEADKVHDVSYEALPRDFSVDDSADVMLPVNNTDIEGDIFAAPYFAWENNLPAPATLIWADAATPDEPFNPQPLPNKTFCEQGMAGRQLVAWAAIAANKQTSVSALYLLTKTGVPNSSIVPLVEQKIAINVNPAVGDPVTVTADHYDETLNAAKVKAENGAITLTITTHSCSGEPVGNTAFVITRDEAESRRGAKMPIFSNLNPVHINDTELTTTSTKFYGRTDSTGHATVTVTQPRSPGVKTNLHIIPVDDTASLKGEAPKLGGENRALAREIAVIFTTKTSPDTNLANMWGHMEETAQITLNGEVYTFTRPALKAEAIDSEGVIQSNNESWARFNWSGADKYCDILPDPEQLMALKSKQRDLEPSLGWPVAGGGLYWSSTASTSAHLAVNMLSAHVVLPPDGNDSRLLESCVDKAAPAVEANITFELDHWDEQHNAAIAHVGETITGGIYLSDKTDTKKPLAYQYFDLWLDDEQNRQGQTNAQVQAPFSWSDTPVAVAATGSRNQLTQIDARHYRGVTDANGFISFHFTQNDGAGVLTPVRIVLQEGTTLTKNVVFSVITSPPPVTTGVHMWGHMQGVIDVEGGQIYKRPVLSDEATGATGSRVENHENWATFNSVDAATAQCGLGQVPGQTSLDHLYSVNSSNKMETEHGWPTGELSYITADFDGSQTTHVNLENGADGQFSGTAPNYLTCSANELVAQLDVYFFDTPTMAQAAVPVGQKIKMNVIATNMLNGSPLPYAQFTISMRQGRNRDNNATGFTDPSLGALVINGYTYSYGSNAQPQSGDSNTVYTGTTDAAGKAEVMLTQPDGVGLKTMLDVKPKNSLIQTTTTRSVTFTVPTSPDTPQAHMWGHMPETLTVGELTFERPKLAEEVTAEGRTQDEANETWVRVLHADAENAPDKGGCEVGKLPNASQLQMLYRDKGNVNTAVGWPIVQDYWSSTFASATTWTRTSLATGTASGAPNSPGSYVSCLTTANPVAATITIEPVDASLWYDQYDEHAVKVRNKTNGNDTELQLKITTKDASGLPVAGVPFVLTRGDGYTRQNVKHTAGSSDGYTSPLVIDGQSLNDTTTQIGGVTGADGSKIITVTRPETHGTKVAITAALYEQPTITASIDTIFTVITSPDTPQAQMWGHMAETLTLADGEAFHRPLLKAEVNDSRNLFSTTENNEEWARLPYFYASNASKTTNDFQCTSAGLYYPTKATLSKLYEAWPNGSITREQGWPTGYSYWSSSIALARPVVMGMTGASTYKYSINLANGGAKSTSTSTSGSNGTYYQTCLSQPPEKPARVVLTSTDASPDGIIDKNAGEQIPLHVSVIGEQGELLDGVPVAIVISEPASRSGASYTSSISLNPILSTQGATTDGNAWNSTPNQTPVVETGSSGTVDMVMEEEGSLGVQHTLQAKLLDDESIVSATLTQRFRVPTSPDSDKATMWGNMPETFTASNGAVFTRPRLYSELSSTTDTDPYTENNENWYTVTNFPLGRGACPLAQMALAADLQALYNDHRPNGAVKTDLGLPIKKNWWAGDQKLDGQSLYWQTVNLEKGLVSTTTNTTNNYALQLCLAEPRQLNVTLSSPTWDADKSAFVAKKGEAMPITVTVTNAGRPQAGAIVRLTREDSYSRSKIKDPTAGKLDPAEKVSGTPADIVMTSTSPTSETKDLYNISVSWLGVTGDDGTIQATLNQDATLGLKTGITATLVEDSGMMDRKDAIFIVHTSPDTPYAAYWGDMPETVELNGRTLRRPPLKTEIDSQPPGSWLFNNETWAAMYIDYGTSKPNTQLTTVCGLENAATLADLQALYPKMNELDWPTSAPNASKSYDYLSQTRTGQGGNDYCSFNETTGKTTCTLEAKAYGFPVCVAKSTAEGVWP